MKKGMSCLPPIQKKSIRGNACPALCKTKALMFSGLYDHIHTLRSTLICVFSELLSVLMGQSALQLMQRNY